MAQGLKLMRSYYKANENKKKEASFVQIDPQEYVEQKLSEGERSETRVKKSRIRARRGRVGEEIVTKMADGHVETKNVVKNADDMIIMNPDGEEYVMPAASFAEQYEKDAQNPQLYKSKDGPQTFLILKENVEFTAPWGEKMKIKKGGALNITRRDKGDIYGIQPSEFEKTYEKCKKNVPIPAMRKKKEDLSR